MGNVVKYFVSEAGRDRYRRTENRSGCAEQGGDSWKRHKKENRPRRRRL